MEKVRVNACFQLLVPLDCPSTVTASPNTTSNTNFGFSVTEQSQLLLFNVRVFCKQRLSAKEYEQAECLSWSKRAPINLEKSTDRDRLLGLVLRIKFKQGAFDFRKVEKRFIRLQIECCNSRGQLMNQGTSQYFQLIPRKRVGSAINAVEGVVNIPVQWQYAIDAFNIANLPDIDDALSAININAQTPPSLADESVLRLFDDTEALPNYDTPHNDSMEVVESPERTQVVTPEKSLDLPLTHASNNEQYMVLYNGHAEVIGNFRALNFYKASDINIKEDIRLLMDEDVDPRGVLLKINGVAYKFKNNIKHATNKRFVGYIAQQIESVVPEAVQLIDGILHVDYESLIPYMSEAIKQNFDDIQRGQSEQDHIKVIVDTLYEDFLQREHKDKTSKEHSVTPRRKSSPWRKIAVAVIGTIVVLSAVMLGLFLYLDRPHDDNNDNQALTPITPAMPAHDSDTDRRALEDFFIATNGGSWNFTAQPRAIRWFSTTHFCSWVGVRCTQGRVTALTLPAMGITGTIPDSIGDLDALDNLNLAINNLTGTLPASISKLKKLTQIWFDVNPHLTGQIPDLPATLYHVWLQFCNFTGTIPATVSHMTQMSELRFDYNQLSGTIPPLPSSEVGQTINLSHNRLEGSLPVITAANLIGRLNVSYNLLSGTLENLAGVLLGSLFLNDNQFSGEVSHVDTAHTYQFYIHNNQFSSFNSSVPPPSGNFLCNAANNVFKCPIPDWFAQRCGATCR